MTNIPAYQKRLLDAITDFWSTNNRPPTIYEMADALDVVPSHITQAAKQLRDRGLLHSRRGLHLPSSNLLRPQEAAEYLGLARSSMQRLMSNGTLQTVRSPGGYNLIPMSELARLKSERIGPRFGVDFSLDDGWGNWLVGFTDGEGTFSVVENKKAGGNYFSARYQLFQRSDRKWILEQVQSNLRCGSLYDRKRRGTLGPGTYFVVGDQPSLTNIIIPFFDRYPPRMKHGEYALWREAVSLIVDGNSNFERVSSIRERLRVMYAYHEP